MDLKYASQSIETHNSINGYVQSLARMFDTGLFASQGRDGDGGSAGKEKKKDGARICCERTSSKLHSLTSRSDAP